MSRALRLRHNADGIAQNEATFFYYYRNALSIG